MRVYGEKPVVPGRRPGGASAGTVAVRVVVTAAVVLSLGLLAWVAMLRLAIMRRTPRDWALFWVQLALTVGCFVLLQERFANSWRSDAGAGLVIVMAIAVVWHYLAADIRHHRAPAAPAPAPYPPQGYGYPAAGVTAPPAPYGPQVPNPYAATVPHPAPHPLPAPPPGPPAATPPPTSPSSPRIDQVRAELDELSDLLRGDGEK
ncbi:hypothetical protein [Streptomyces termitum]|uniref:hypothetical protein n=1 Tax=Streptomyces termitum TaxID=67368 RepID=UPI0033B147AA